MTTLKYIPISNIKTFTYILLDVFWKNILLDVTWYYNQSAHDSGMGVSIKKTADRTSSAHDDGIYIEL